MALFMIGIGLFDEKDITLRGLDAIKSSDKVYLENYTSILSIQKERLEELYGKEVILADRNFVEQGVDEMLDIAKHKNISFLVVGDVFGATTHTDLLLRAKNLGIKVNIIHNASILNAIGIVGLELYKYGKTTSIVFSDEKWMPHTPYDVIKQNKSMGLHTLCLLDIKVSEPSVEDLMKGINNPLPPRFMTVKEGLETLKLIEKERSEGLIDDDTMVIGLARIGHPDEKIVYGKLSEVVKVYFGKPLHAIIIPGNIHHIEEEALKLYSYENTKV